MKEKDLGIFSLIAAAIAGGGYVLYRMIKGALSISSVEPKEGFQGEILDVTIKGKGFVEVASITFGSGITVTSFIVDSKEAISAKITIAATATVGSREVSVNAKSGLASLKAGFRVIQAGSVQFSGFTISYR